ncbi:MAG: lysylphosphatidylglycerol synthase domain-containing protein [Rhodanobacteraceae bacterium]
MKRIGYLLGLLGLAAATALVIHQGWSAVFGAIDHAGWRLLWLLPFHAVPLLLDVFGWRVLLSRRDPARRATIPILFWIATVREAVNRLLPVASIGGEVVGIRLLKRRGIDAAAGAASVIVEVMLTVANQYLFVGLGLVLLIESAVDASALESVLVALVVSLPVPIALIALLRYGRMFSRLEFFAKKLFGGSARLLAELIDGVNLDREIRTLCSAPGRLLGACSWQLLGLVVGSLESWLVLRWLGHPVGVAGAIALEASTQVLRHIFFVVPAGLGVQEGGLLLIGNVLGLPADMSIALSLVKRMREIAFGVPALISWQWTEAHRLHTMWRGDESHDATI